MTTQTFMARSQKIRAIQYTGSNIEALEELTKDGDAVLTSNPDGTVNLYRPGDRHMVIYPYWWLSLAEDGHVTAHSNDAFTRQWEKI